MFRKLILGVAALVACFSIGATALADPWKDESGKGKGWGQYKKEWKEHGKETPPWARGKGYWDGHLKHDRLPDYYRGSYGQYHGGNDWGGHGYSTYHNEIAPPHCGWHHPAPPPPHRYGPAPHAQGWDIHGVIRIYPRYGW